MVMGGYQGSIGGAEVTYQGTGASPTADVAAPPGKSLNQRIYATVQALAQQVKIIPSPEYVTSLAIAGGMQPTTLVSEEEAPQTGQQAAQQMAGSTAGQASAGGATPQGMGGGGSTGGSSMGSTTFGGATGGMY